MLNLGEYNTLIILRSTPPGLFLGDDEGEEVLLPNRYVPKSFAIGDKIDVFLYLDNEERPVATTDTPLIQKGGFALLRCNQVTSFGSFLEWGLVKELFCPFKEQIFKMKAGGWYLVHCYLDEETNRLVASSKTNQFLDNTQLSVKQFDEVDIIVSHPSELGMNVIVNNKHKGLIFKDDIFKPLTIGDRLIGVVKKIRKDNKLDIILSQIGYRNIEPDADFILRILKKHEGFLEITDKSDPELIKALFQMSKKRFKKGLGSLYKQRLIRIEENGLHIT